MIKEYFSDLKLLEIRCYNYRIVNLEMSCLNSFALLSSMTCASSFDSLLNDSAFDIFYSRRKKVNFARPCLLVSFSTKHTKIKIKVSLDLSYKFNVLISIKAFWPCT